MPENPEFGIDDVDEVEGGGGDAADWEDIAPDKLTFDDVWKASTTAPEQKTPPDEEEGEDDTPRTPPPSSKKVKVGRDELEVGDGPGQWTEDQIKTLQQYKKEADSQKSSAQSLEAAMDRLARQSAQVQQRLEQIESGSVSKNAPQSAQEPRSGLLDRATALDAELGADGAVSGIIGDLYAEMQSLKKQSDGVATTTKAIEYEKIQERESAGLYRDLADVGIDPNDTSSSFEDAPEGTTPYSHGLAWMMAYQRNMREQGMKEEEVYTPAWLSAARYFAAWKVSSDLHRASLGDNPEPVKAQPKPTVPWMRQRTTPSAVGGKQRSQSFSPPEMLSDEDRALIPS